MSFSARVQKSLPIIADPRLAAWQSMLAPLVRRALPPPTPQNFQITNVRGGLQLSWSPVQRTSVQHGPDGYELLRSVDGSFSGDVQVIPIKDIRQTSYFDSFGSPTTAHYRIRATGGSKSNPQSVRGPDSGVVNHLSLDPSDIASSPTTRRDAYTTDRVRSTARFGNYGLDVYQGSPTINGAPSSSVVGGQTAAAVPQVVTSSSESVSGITFNLVSPQNDDILAYDSTSASVLNQTAVSLGLEKVANKDAASGYAGLDAGTLLKLAEFPAVIERNTNKDSASGYAGLDASTKLSRHEVLGQYTVAALPTGTEGDVAYATNGRKVGEGVGAGTGVPTYFSNALWRRYSDDTQVLA